MSWDAAVIGGGLAGAAAACRLAEAGRRVVLLERERRPGHKVCGEFVSIEAQQHLAGLGLCHPGAAPPLGAAAIDRLRLVGGAVEATAALPFPAWGLSRQRLDAWLLGEAARRGAVVRTGEAVQGLEVEIGRARIATASGSEVAEAAVLATGKHELRGHRRQGTPSGLIGLKLHLRLAEAQARDLAGHVELVLFPGGYAGLLPIERGLANLCLLVTKERFARLGRDWRGIVAATPHLARRLAGGDACWPRPLAVYRVPYGYLHRDQGDGPVYRVGDQAAVIPSFTGDGMAMALHSGRLAADAILAGEPPAGFHSALAGTFRRPVRLAGLIAAAGALPSLQPVLARLCRLAPALMQEIARQTRIAA